MASSPSHKQRRHILLSATLLIAAVVLFTAPGGGICGSAHASTNQPADYCYQTDIAITYSGSGTLTNVPVRVVINANGMVGTGQLNREAWDIKPILGSMTNELNLTAQSMNSGTSPWWIFLPEISQGQTRTTRLYTGSGEQRRDQGIWFTGNEYVVVSDDNVLDVPDLLRIDISLENLSNTLRGGNFVAHFVSAQGYRVRFVNVGGANPLGIALEVDSGLCATSFNPAWTNERQVFTFTYDDSSPGGADTRIFRNGTQIQQCNLNVGPIAAVAEPLVIGASSQLAGPLANAIINDVKVWNSSTLVAHYGFDAVAMTETVATNPFEGTVEDYGPNNLTGAYTFNRPQTDFTYSIGPTQLVSGASQVSLPDTNPDVLGPAFGFDPADNRPELQSGWLYTLFLGPLADSSPVRAAGFTIGLSTIGWILALIVQKTLKYTPLALFVWGLPYAAGIPNGWIAPYWIILWVILAIGGWFAQRQTETAS